MKILVVDDDPIMRDALSVGLALEWPDATILVASDGLEALDEIAALSPDLVLLDVTLPHLSGFDVLQRLRARYAVPVIVMTGRGEVSDHDRARGLGADDFIAKPFEHTDLVYRINSVLHIKPQLPRPMTYAK